MNDNLSHSDSAEGDFLHAALGRLRDALKEDLKGLARLREGQTVPSNPVAKLAESVAAEAKTLAEAEQSGRTLRLKQVELRHEALAAAPLQVADSLKNRVENRKTTVTVPVENGFVVAGRVLDSATGNGLANVRVVVLERDPNKDDLLGETRTDALGYFRLEYRGEEFHELMDKQPETYIQVQDEAGNVVYNSDRSFRHKAAAVEILNAAIDGTKVPSGRREGEQTESQIQNQIRELEQEAKVARQRKAVFASNPFATSVSAPRKPRRSAPRKRTGR